MVDHGIEEHRDLKKAMYELDGKTAKDAAFDACVQRVWKSLSHHMEEEEESILPKLEKMATAAELEELGNKFSKLEIIAPSRVSHAVNTREARPVRLPVSRAADFVSPSHSPLFSLPLALVLALAASPKRSC